MLRAVERALAWRVIPVTRIRVRADVDDELRTLRMAMTVIDDVYNAIDSRRARTSGDAMITATDDECAGMAHWNALTPSAPTRW